MCDVRTGAQSAGYNKDVNFKVTQVVRLTKDLTTPDQSDILIDR